MNFIVKVAKSGPPAGWLNSTEMRFGFGEPSRREINLATASACQMTSR